MVDGTSIRPPIGLAVDVVGPVSLTLAALVAVACPQFGLVTQLRRDRGTALFQAGLNFSSDVLALELPSVCCLLVVRVLTERCILLQHSRSREATNRKCSFPVPTVCPTRAEDVLTCHSFVLTRWYDGSTVAGDHDVPNDVVDSLSCA